MIKSKFIYNILDLLLDGDEVGLSYREHLDHLSDVKFEYTWTGLFVSFEYDEISLNLNPNFNQEIDGVTIKSEMHDVDALVRLVFHEGIISYLEIWNGHGSYPKEDLKEYSMFQDWKDSPGRKIIVKLKWYQKLLFLLHKKIDFQNHKKK